MGKNDVSLVWQGFTEHCDLSVAPDNPDNMDEKKFISDINEFTRVDE